MLKKLIVLGLGFVTICSLSSPKAFASSSDFNVLVLPNTTKTLSTEEAINALKDYKKGLVLIKTEVSQPLLAEQQTEGLAVLRSNSSSEFELTVPANQYMRSWTDMQKNILFVYCDKALLFIHKPDENGAAPKEFSAMLKKHLANKVNAGKICLIDSSSLSLKKEYADIKDGNDEIKEEYQKFLFILAYRAIEAGADVVVLLDPTFNASRFVILPNNKAAAILLPKTMGSDGAMGAFIDITNGQIKVRLVDR